MIWYILPLEANSEISWEGHLSGAFTGSISAVVFRNKGPQKPQKIWDDEDDDNEEEDDEQHLKQNINET
jgi:hypothetical protein